MLALIVNKTGGRLDHCVLLAGEEVLGNSVLRRRASGGLLTPRAYRAELAACLHA